MDTPALRQLVAAYFHPDWHLEHEDEWANLQDFLAGEPLTAQLPADVDAVLAAFKTDDEIGRYLQELGSYYIPTQDQGGSRAWLQEVSRRAQAYTRGE